MALEFTRDEVLIILTTKQSNPYKDFSIFSQKCTVHYAYKRADLNLILVVEMTNGFIFQTIDSLVNNFLLTISMSRDSYEN